MADIFISYDEEPTSLFFLTFCLAIVVEKENIDAT